MATITLEKYKKAYEMGKKHAETGNYTEWLTPALSIAYNLGRWGSAEVKWEIVNCLRAGNIPECGLSWNYRDNKSESGLSVLNVIGEKEVGSAVWFSERDVIEVKGIRLPYTGSDGETLILPLGIDEFDFN